MGKKHKRRKPLKSKPVYGPGVAESLGIVSITRIEALVRVLESAIWLWALEADPLPIHILVMSQFQCLEDIGKTKGKLPLASTTTDPTQRNVVYDFLRHASGSLSAGVDFTPIMNFGFLYDAVCTFDDLFGKTTPYMKAFLTYFQLWFPQAYPQLGHIAHYELPKGVTVADFHMLSRADFFVKLLEAFGGDGFGVHIESP